MPRRGLTIGLALALPILLIFSLLVFVVLTQPDDDCLPGDLGVDIPAEPVAITTQAPFRARVASWNTLAANSTGRIVNGIDAIRASSDVIGLQELNPESRRSAVERALHRGGWAISDGNNSVQIAWRASRYRALAQGSEKVFDVERMEGGTAGTSIGPKSVQWVQLQDRQTSGVFFVVNHHLVPDIDRSGHPRPGAPKRIALYQRQMAGMLSVVQKLRTYGPVAVTGDFNVAAKADAKVKDPRFPYVLMGRAGLLSNWQAVGYPSRGTHGNRLIDYVWLTKSNGRFVDQRILGKYGSDHSAVVATITNAAGGQGGGQGGGPSPAPSSPAAQLPASITVQVNNQQVKLLPEQIEIAATAIREGKALGVPQRGWIIAIAAALQESGLRNLAGGDRDSVGPWQMRPSTGWGTVEQIGNVPMAARAFYGMADHTQNPGLVDVDGWEQMTVAQAAQAVERSAFPDAYAKWEPAARSIVEQLANVVGAGTGSPGCDTGAGLAGDLSGDCPATDLPAEDVLTPDGLLVLRCVAKQFPAIQDIGTYPGHDPDESRAVDIMIPGWDTASGRELGNQIAKWVKDHQTELGVHYIVWHGQIWNIERDGEGWRRYFDADNPNPNRSHNNHVHVSVWGNKGTGPADATGPLTAGAWHTPVGDPSRVGCGFGCYSGHTGQDFPAPPGVPVYAVNSGTVVRSESITTSGNCTTLPICGGTRISYGNLIVIKLAGGGDITAYYAHLSARNVREGQTVQAGQVIGAVGYEGNVKPKGPGGSHLHFEIRRGGTPVEPLQYLRSKGVQP